MTPIFVSKRVIEHKRIEKIMKTHEVILVFSGFELKQDFEAFDQCFILIDEKNLTQINPKLTFVSEMEVGDIYVYISGTDSFNKIDRTPNFGVNNATFAHNQGKMNPAFSTWMKYNTDYWYWIIGLISLLLLGIGISWLFFIPFFIVGLIFFAKWKKVNSLFNSGDANPGIVVGLNPTLIAVYTDLTKGLGKFPIIKITPTPLDKTQNQNLKIGDRLATIALYTSYVDDEIPHWADFSPIPINLAITNQTEIDAVMSRFHADDWAELESRIATLSKPYQVGTYKVTNQLNNWAESPIQKLGIN